MKQVKFLVLAAVVAFGMASCSSKQGGEEQTVERVEQVKVMTLTKTEFDRVVTLSSTLQGYETLSVSPAVTGKIEHIYVEEGSVVSTGDSLVRMSQTQIRTSKLAHANLGVELGRMEAMLKAGSVTQQAYDQLKVSYDQSQENIDFLELNTYYRAPFSGVISAKNYEDGELYSGQPILVLTQINTLKAEIALPERYYNKVRKGMPLSIRSEIYPDETFNATVETVFPTIDPASHTFFVKVRVPNAKQALRPGMYIFADISLGREDATVVPYQAVLKLQGANDRYVFLNRGGKAVRVPVELGQRFDDQVEIISDEITETDELVVAGQGRLVDGVKLNVVK